MGTFLDVRAFRLGFSLLNTDLSFLANINFAGNIPDLVLGFGVMLKIFRNSWNIFSSDSPPPIFKRLLNVSAKRSTCFFDLGWYRGVVICCICKDLKKNLNSLEVNCVPFSDTIESGTPKLAKISCYCGSWSSVFQYFMSLGLNVDYHQISMLYLTAQRNLDVNGTTDCRFQAKDVIQSEGNSPHDVTKFWMSLSIFDEYVLHLIRRFIIEVPG